MRNNRIEHKARTRFTTHHCHDTKKCARRARCILPVHHIDGRVRKQIVVDEIGIELGNLGIVPVCDAAGKNVGKRGAGKRLSYSQ